MYNERNAKMQYVNEMRNKFKATNKNLAIIKRALKEANKEQEIKDEIKLITITLRKEKKLDWNEKLK